MSSHISSSKRTHVDVQVVWCLFQRKLQWHPSEFVQGGYTSVLKEHREFKGQCLTFLCLFRSPGDRRSDILHLQRPTSSSTGCKCSLGRLATRGKRIRRQAPWLNTVVIPCGSFFMIYWGWFAALCFLNAMLMICFLVSQSFGIRARTESRFTAVYLSNITHISAWKVRPKSNHSTDEEDWAPRVHQFENIRITGHLWHCCRGQRGPWEWWVFDHLRAVQGRCG